MREKENMHLSLYMCVCLLMFSLDGCILLWLVVESLIICLFTNPYMSSVARKIPPNMEI